MRLKKKKICCPMETDLSKADESGLLKAKCTTSSTALSHLVWEGSPLLSLCNALDTVGAQGPYQIDLGTTRVLVFMGTLGEITYFRHGTSSGVKRSKLPGKMQGCTCNSQTF